MLKVKLLCEGARVPTRATEGSAGLDLYLANPIIWDCEPITASTGVAVEVPRGHVGLLVLRSSVARMGLSMVNSVGIIDSDYRGEILLTLKTWMTMYRDVKVGERIGQLVICPCPQYTPVEVNELDSTERGEGGFGSTGA